MLAMISLTCSVETDYRHCIGIFISRAIENGMKRKKHNAAGILVDAWNNVRVSDLF